MEESKPQLTDGSEWMDHEDCIVGDERGLKNLIQACEAALEDGEYYGNDLGDYVGIKRTLILVGSKIQWTPLKLVTLILLLACFC